MQVSITIDDRAPRRMLRKAPAQLFRAQRAALNDGSALVLRDLKRYPPPPPRSKYRRTRTQGRSWGRRFEGSRENQRVIVGSSGRMAPYNRHVQDASMQARIHRGRWPTVQSVAADREPVIRGMFRQRIRQFVGR